MNQMTLTEATRALLRQMREDLARIDDFLAKQEEERTGDPAAATPLDGAKLLVRVDGVAEQVHYLYRFVVHGEVF